MQLQQNTTPLVSHQYTYDTMSRLATVGDGTHTAAYSRIPGGNLLLPLICNVLNFSRNPNNNMLPGDTELLVC